MNRFTFTGCFIILLILAVPVTAAETPIISSISPSVGETGDTTTVTITGQNFGSVANEVWLQKSGQSDIDVYSISSWTNTSIVCRFKISSSAKTGAWDLVVMNNDDVKGVESNGFTIREPMTLTSINPTHGQVDDDEVDFIILGTGLSDVDDVILYNNDYDNITAVDVVVISSIRVEGTFDLSDTDEDSYDVCVVDESGFEECDLSFEITTDEVGSIDISSSPSGASIYVDGTLEGTTPEIITDLVEGSYKIVLKKAGYDEWGKIVRVTAGDTSIVDADLDAVTTAPTAAPTSRPTTVKTTAKSTLKVPTAWPSDTPATAASPLDPALIAGTVCLAFIALRKH